MLSWHVLSEGKVHYQHGHTSLECVERRGTSCLKEKSTISVDTRVLSVLSVVYVELAHLV